MVLDNIGNSYFMIEVSRTSWLLPFQWNCDTRFSKCMNLWFFVSFIFPIAAVLIAIFSLCHGRTSKVSPCIVCAVASAGGLVILFLEGGKSFVDMVSRARVQGPTWNFAAHSFPRGLVALGDGFGWVWISGMGISFTMMSCGSDSLCHGITLQRVISLVNSSELPVV